MTQTLVGRTILMSGGSRGIGLAIALRAARDGANVVMLAKTAEPHPKLEGTVYTAVEVVERAGGKGLAVVGDVRNEEDVRTAVDGAVRAFGGIDIVVNNASAIDLSPSEQLEMKRYDLMQDINTRGTFLLSKTAIPHLREADNPHILTLSPPLNLAPHWVGKHLGYTLAKYGMSLCTIGLAEELAADGIAANSLWPRTLIDTAAVRNVVGGARRCQAPPNHGRCRIRHPHPQRPGVHRQPVHRRRGAGRRGCHRPDRLHPRPLQRRARTRHLSRPGLIASQLGGAFRDAANRTVPSAHSMGRRTVRCASLDPAQVVLVVAGG